MVAADVPSDDRLAWAHQVLSILAGLPARQADALRLLYFEHQTEHEVAERMGVALDHARAVAAEGLRSLGLAICAAHARSR